MLLPHFALPAFEVIATLCVVKYITLIVLARWRSDDEHPQVIVSGPQEAYGGRISWTAPPPAPPQASQKPGFAVVRAASEGAGSATAPPGLSAGDSSAPAALHEASGNTQQDSGQHGSSGGGGSGRADRQAVLLPFEGADVGEQAGRLQVGQPVTFLVTHDRRTALLRAAEVSRLTPHPPISSAPHATSSAIHTRSNSNDNFTRSTDPILDFYGRKPVA